VILDVVREELNMEISNGELLNKINISNQQNSQVILIDVVDESPEKAAAIANTITTVFWENVQDLIDVNRFTVLSEAEPNFAPLTPNKPLSVIMGAFIGLGSGVALALLLNFMDRTVKDDKFISDKLKWTPLGHVERVSEKMDATFEIDDLSEELPETSAVRSEV
jgi:capsular polysaccharide biosynthesis protein